MTQHFLDIKDFDTASLRAILDRAVAFKSGVEKSLPLQGKTLAMIFEKSSTRTRVSFEVAASQLGGHGIVLSSKEMQLGRGETVADTAKVLSRYVDAIMIRTDAHSKLLELAEYATVPVINGLTDQSHPCQLIADVLTIEEQSGPIEGKTIAYCGDAANNMATTLMQAAVKLRFKTRFGCPDDYAPDQETLKWALEHQAQISVFNDPIEAVSGADAVITDTWISMGDKDAEKRKTVLDPYRVDKDLMAHASKTALFLHCLPAHRGEEVSHDVIDGPQSVVFDEAENRLHAQKAILSWCMEHS